MMIAFFKKIFKIFLLTTVLLVVASTTGLSPVKTAFAEEWSSSIDMDTVVQGGTLPSPGDTITVKVTLTNTDPDYRFYADGLIIAHIKAVLGETTNSSYFTSPDPDGYLPAGTILNKSGLAGDSTTITFTTGIKPGDNCTALYTQIKATPQYVGTAGGARNTNSYTTNGGIGANLYLAVYKADETGAYGAQVRVNSGNWITLSASTYAYIFYNLNCASQNFVEARSGTQYGSAYMSVRNTENADSYLNRFICNGQQRSLSIRMSLPPSPSPSSSSSPNPSASPSPPANTVSLTSSCNPAALSASWNRGPGSTCNAYIQAGSCAHQLSTACTGSWSGTSLPASGTCNTGLWTGWSGALKVSNGTDEISDSETISCTSSPPPGGSGCYNFKCRTRPDANTSYIDCVDITRNNLDPAVCGGQGGAYQWCLDNQAEPPDGNCYTRSYDANRNLQADTYCDKYSATCSTPKYKCDGASCIRDDANGTLPAGCNNTCLATCSTNVTMNASPNPATQGGNIIFSVTGDAQASWCIGDTWTTGSLSGNDCTCTAAGTNNCGIWTPAFGTRSCTAASSNPNPYTWAHYWRINTSGPNPCNTGTPCSKTATFTINPAISAWIQVTGDVHSNTMIRAPGGP